MPLMGVRSRSAAQSWLQREQLVLSPSICQACPVLQLRQEMLVGTPGSMQSAEEVLHPGKGKGGRVGSTRS